MLYFYIEIIKKKFNKCVKDNFLLFLPQLLILGNVFSQKGQQISKISLLNIKIIFYSFKLIDEEIDVCRIFFWFRNAREYNEFLQFQRVH